MDTNAAETQNLLYLLVRSLVSNREAVRVCSVKETACRTTFTVHMGPEDVGKVVGKQGKIANAIRVLLTSIGRQHGISYRIELNDKGSVPAE